MKNTIENQHEKCRTLLRDNHCKLINSCKVPKAVADSELEFWQTPRGLLICQFFKYGGVATFADWPLGDSWEKLEVEIQPTILKKFQAA